MSARRQARRGVTVAEVRDDGKVPECLDAGPIIEVWCDPKVLAAHPIRNDGARPVQVITNANRRYDLAKDAWLERNGISRHDGWKLIPARAAVLAVTTTHPPAHIRALTEQADALFAAALGKGALAHDYHLSKGL